MAYAVGALFAMAAVLAHVHVGVPAGLAAYALVCCLGAVLVTPGLAAVVGLSGWGFLTGFVVNTGGRLSFAGSDLRHLVLLLVLPVAVAALGHGSRV